MDTESDPATIIMGIAALASVGGTVASMTQGGPSVPKPPDQTNTLAAAYQQAEQMRRRAGSASTILTGPAGLTGTAATGKASLGD